jgi:hypothetical protein
MRSLYIQTVMKYMSLRISLQVIASPRKSQRKKLDRARTTFGQVGITGFSDVVPPPFRSFPHAALMLQGLQPYSVHLCLHHTHVVLTATVGLLAKSS